jgi:hypothetical protein
VTGKCLDESIKQGNELFVRHILSEPPGRSSCWTTSQDGLLRSEE